VRARDAGAPDANETEAVRCIPLAEIPGLIASGEINGAATIIGVQHVLLMWLCVSWARRRGLKERSDG
jgi:hypothetical protein